MKIIPLIGRVLFSVLFIFAAVGKLLSGKVTGYAASMGVPAASVLVPVAGVIALVGGLMILLGFKAKIGGWLIVLFLLPVTLWMHRFWSIADAQQQQEQILHFVTNFSLLGGALAFAYFGSGPFSITKEKLD